LLVFQAFFTVAALHVFAYPLLSTGKIFVGRYFYTGGEKNVAIENCYAQQMEK
jgi:hypothetical protein